MAVVGSGSHTAHMRPDESKQVLLQLHFEFRWIVRIFFFCARSIYCRFRPTSVVARESANVTFCTQGAHFVRAVVNRQQRRPGTDRVPLTECASGGADWMACATMKYKSVSVCEREGGGVSSYAVCKNITKKRENTQPQNPILRMYSPT